MKQNPPILTLFAAAFLFSLPAEAQSSGRFEESKRTGMALFEGEHYEKASGKLEEVWEQDKSDPTVGEYLAMAYLNTEDRQSLTTVEKQAFEIIEKLQTSGQRVSFLILHSHEKLGWLQGRELNNYCRGKVSIKAGHLIYIADKGDKQHRHTFDLTGSGITKIWVNEDDKRGTFQMKTGSENYYFVTRNRNRNEARFFVDLVKKTIQ